MSQEIDTIKAKLNVIDLIGEYVRLQKAGNNWKACCPFHNEKTPSFSVSEDKQVWHCFGCGKGGDAFGFLMEIEGLTFREALENLAQRTGVELPKYNRGDGNITPEERNKVWDILELANLFYEKQLWEGMGKNKILKYLRERGLEDNTISEFRLGYAPQGWRNVLQFLISKGYEVGDIYKSGLIVQKENSTMSVDNFYDRFRDRIMFPISNGAGRIIGYSARINPDGDESQAKYINTPETEIYNKSSVLYGIDKAKMSAKEKDWILLVEGNMDVIASWQAGIKNVVAVSGTALTPEQLNIIKRYTKNIKMFFDMDEAGQKAASRSTQLAFEKELNVSIVSIKDGKDAADIVREDVSKFMGAVNNSVGAMEYFIGQISSDKNKNNIEDKKKIISELTFFINSFSNKVEREYWIKKISELLDISENILFDEFSKFEYYSKDKEMGNSNLAKNNDNDLVYDKVKDIQIQIMGAFISDDNIWKEAVNKYEKDILEYFDNQKVIQIIINDGKATSFNFEKLLEGLSNEEQRRFLRELYFKNCEKNEALSSIKEQWLAIDQYFNELKRQIKHRKSAKLIDGIKEAEKSKNKELIKKLSEELMKINNI